MQKAVSHAIYVLGLLFGITSVVSGAIDGALGAVLGTALALAIWWIAVGLGVRMGLSPDDFLVSLKRFLGFGVEYDKSQGKPSEDPIQ